MRQRKGLAECRVRRRQDATFDKQRNELIFLRVTSDERDFRGLREVVGLDFRGAAGNDGWCTARQAMGAARDLARFARSLVRDRTSIDDRQFGVLRVADDFMPDGRELAGEPVGLALI